MFDPFEYRTSRDIRNQLCNGFLAALHDGDRSRFNTGSAALKQKAPDPPHRDFIDERIRRYNILFNTLGISDCPAENPAKIQTDAMPIAALLLSSDLFYECHEWLEEFWLQAVGPEKKALQALIRTAGAFTLHEAGRIQPARSSAQKACALLREFKDHIPAPFDPDQLSTTLKKIIKTDCL